MSGRGEGRGRRGRGRGRGAILACGALLAVLAWSAPAPALSEDETLESFESPAFSGSFVQLNAPASVGDWRVTAGSVDHVNTYWQPADGARSIDLNGTSRGTLCRTFEIFWKGTAAVRFMMSHNPDAAATSGTLQVLANGTQVGGTFVHSAASTRSNMLWEARGVTFTVTTPTLELCFRSLSGAAQGPALDAVIFAQPYPGYAYEVESDRPFVWYRLGEDAAQPLVDSAGPHHGACVNGATFGRPGAIADRVFPRDGARGFDGRAAYCYANGIAAPTQAYTLEAWMRPSQSPPRAGTIADHGGAGALYITPSSFCMRNAWESLCWPGDPYDGFWHHVAATWSASDGVARLYVDGRLRASAVSGARPSGSGTFHIGYGQSAPWLTGSIDEVAYYARALSSDRIATHERVGCHC